MKSSAKQGIEEEEGSVNTPVDTAALIMQASKREGRGIQYERNDAIPDGPIKQSTSNGSPRGCQQEHQRMDQMTEWNLPRVLMQS